MKSIRQILFAAALTLAAFVPKLEAATWNDAYGVGFPGAINLDNQIGAFGIPFTVIASVLSNCVYTPISSKPAAPAVIDDVSFKTDLCAAGAALKFYQATNTWTFASNATAGATTFWLTTTNSQMATNDICLVQDVANDCYQMIVISGNATDYAGAIATNALGEVQVKTFNTITNAIVAGDKLYKMASVFNVNPLTITSLTNGVPLIGAYPTNANTCFSQWLPLTFSGFGSPDRVKFRLRAGVPGLITLTYSNAGGLVAGGQYLKRGSQ